MAQETKFGSERTGTAATDPTSNVLSPSSTSGSRTIDPETHTISDTPGMHTGREAEIGRAQSRAGGMADRTQGKTHQMADQAREKAGHLADEARSKVTSRLDSQKEHATETIGSISSALRETGDSLRSNEEDQIAGFLDTAAEQVDRFNEYLRNRSATDLLDEAQRLARREPALFIGGAFVLGLLGARFLKSHSPARDYYGGYEAGYGGGYEGGYGGRYEGGGYEGGGYEGGGYEGGYSRSGYRGASGASAYRGPGSYRETGAYDTSRTGAYRDYETPARSSASQPRDWEVD